jgi:2,3-bisphosphoglycerate-independent phosphoglycerate mutase
MRVILIILDGWGVAPPGFGNAIRQARTPTLNAIEQEYPSCLLQASGIGVGLPWGEEGNSEVGHLNIGAGSVVLQYLPRIITSIRDGSFFENKTFTAAAAHVKKYSSSLHFAGLVSSGSVHSYIDHLYGLLEFARREKISKVYLHIFTDGKDSPPKEAAKFVQQLDTRLRLTSLGEIATVIGRAYAMDRNEKWQATQKTYELLTKGKGEVVPDASSYLEDSYARGINDQYIEPAVIKSQIIKDGDAVVFFNFREDSMRQLTRVFIEDDFKKFQRKKVENLFFVAMTQYDEATPSLHVAFPPPSVPYPLAQVLEEEEKKQLRIAESEKYAHITYFFNGFREKPYLAEERILIPSFNTPHYEQHPKMQALKITEKAIEYMNAFDFTLINFANADMLGHTGDISATVQGVETIDECIKKILSSKTDETALLITADHGKAEAMLEPATRQVKTKHTTSPVPFYLVVKEKRGFSAPNLLSQTTKGILADVAPTVLELMEIPAPKEMTGQSLLPLL